MMKAKLPRCLFALIALLVITACSRESERAKSVVTHELVYEHHVRSASTEIWAARCDGTKPAKLVDGIEPIISPNGRWIAFTRINNRERADLFLLDRRRHTVRLLRHSATSISWNHKSEILAVTGDALSEKRDIVTINPRDKSTITLVRGNVAYPALNPAENKLVYLDEKKGNIYMLHLLDGSYERITNNGASRFAIIGSRYIAVTEETTRRSNTTTIWLHAISSGSNKKIELAKNIANDGGIEAITWLKGGEILLIGLNSERGGYGSIAILNARTGKQSGLYKLKKPYGANKIQLNAKREIAIVTEQAEGRRPRLRIYDLRKRRTISVIKNAMWPSWNC